VAPLDSVRGVSVDWSDEVDEILGGELTAGLAYLTPAKGVMISPMAPLGLRDRDAGTITLSSSLALWKKLDRMRRNPGVAVVYHARDYALHDRPGFVLVQGRASFDTTPDRAWLESITPQWNQFLGKRSTGLIGRTQHVYYWERIAINIAVERVVYYRDTRATGEPEVFGAPLAPPPAPQKTPGKGTEPRVDVGKVASSVAKLPHTLLGWCGSDEMPEVVPVSAAEAAEDGLWLTVPPDRVPPGGRRAGLTSHAFQAQMLGQNQRIHSGWLEANGEAFYSPHSRAGYALPASKPLYLVACASLATRMRAARKAGIAPAK
jgi:hypothetical protein